MKQEHKTQNTNSNLKQEHSTKTTILTQITKQNHKIQNINKKPSTLTKNVNRNTPQNPQH